MRDAVSAAQNLLLLLRSPKVGPSPISSILAEVRQGISATPAALGVLLRGVALDGDEAAQALQAFLQGHMAEAAAAIARAEPAALDARARLSLELTMQRLIPGLNAAHELAELLILVDVPPAELDTAELLEASFAPPSRPGLIGPSVVLHVNAPLRGQHALRTNPRAAMRLLRVALSTFLQGGDSLQTHADAPHLSLRVEPASANRVHLRLARGRSHGDAIEVRVPQLVPPTLPVLSLFCDRIRVGLDRSTPSSLGLTFSSRLRRRLPGALGHALSAGL